MLQHGSIVKQERETLPFTYSFDGHAGVLYIRHDDSTSVRDFVFDSVSESITVNITVPELNDLGIY